MEPKFKVGEEVIVCCKLDCHINGDAKIISLRFGIGILHYSRKRIQTWAYEIDRPTAPYKYIPEQNLRKKHKPGDSFESIMNECKTGEMA